MECDGMGYLALLLSSRLGIYLSSNNQPINESNQKSIYLPINQVYASVYLFSCCSTPIFHLLSTYPTSISFPTCLLSTGSISISLFLYLSIYLSMIYPSIHPSIYAFHVSIYLYTYYVCKYKYMYIYIYMDFSHSSIFLSICAYPSMYVLISQYYFSIHFSEYLFINLQSSRDFNELMNRRDGFCFQYHHLGVCNGCEEHNKNKQKKCRREAAELSYWTLGWGLSLPNVSWDQENQTRRR